MSDVLPPPPPPRSSDGCWKWGAITCGVGCAVLVLVVVVGGYFLMKSPLVKNIREGAENAKYATTEMKEVWTQVDKFHKDKNKYPDKLENLVPNYLTKDQLHFSRQPTGPEWTYHKPPPDSDSSFIILEYKVDFRMPVAPGQPSPTWNLTITKDGVQEMQSNTTYNSTGPRVRVKTKDNNSGDD